MVKESGEPITGANALRLPRTHHDPLGRICRGRLPARLRQTGPDTRFVPGGQGVAGSNPPAGTANQDHVDTAPLTCGQPSGQHENPQVRAKREYLTIASRSEATSPGREVASRSFDRTLTAGFGGILRHVTLVKSGERHIMAEWQ
jgi:hypothetical protein